MSRSRNTNRKHRRKAYRSGAGVAEHTKRNQRRRKAKKVASVREAEWRRLTSGND